MLRKINKLAAQTALTGAFLGVIWGVAYAPAGVWVLWMFAVILAGAWLKVVEKKAGDDPQATAAKRRSGPETAASRDRNGVL